MLAELTRLRIDLSKTLLQTTNTKIQRVAEQSGFPSRVHFTSVFTRLLNQSPKVYRQACQKADEA